MKDFIMWLVFLAIDIFKVAIVFIVIFGIAAVCGALYFKEFINLQVGETTVKALIGSVIVAVLALIGFATVFLFFFVMPAYEALKHLNA